MKRLLLFLMGALLSLTGCQKEEMDIFTSSEPTKSVTISADVAPATRATLDSQTGKFSWQKGDQVSVLATDGKFYTFTMADETGGHRSEFTGVIPESAFITTVALHPAIVPNGSDNQILSGTTLNYTLPTEYQYINETTNVPMVATFGENATNLSFRQIGGVMRFVVKNMPLNGKFELTSYNKSTTGVFPLDITKVGEESIVAAEGESTVSISYVSKIDGATATFNVPVPTGIYNDFSVSIKDEDDNLIYTKKYSADNKVDRATLLIMSEIELSERPMRISQVWPFFVDARVTFSKYEGVDTYAFYIDGSDEPVIMEGEDLGEFTGALIGGNFAHKSTHTVSVAKVVEGEILKSSKSESVEFTTGRVMQVRYNTGTRFICAGWDDVAVGTENSTVYDEATKKWSLFPVKDEVNGRNIRGYRVQLYADDKTTLLYDEIPFSGQVDYGGAISSSSWIGKIGGQNVLLPTALSFGWLEPGKSYYFRVQTLPEPLLFNSPETDYFHPTGEGVTLSSLRGGCGWSELVEMTTDAPHVASENEVLFEGFDDMMYNSDIMNVAPAAVPQVLTEAAKDSEYKSRKSGELYKEWVAQPFEERKFSEQGFNTMLGAYYMGLTDDSYSESTVGRYFNEYAGSLQGWSIWSGGSDTRTVNPNFGSVRLGQSGSASGKVTLRTPAINSDKLSETKPTKCIITVKVSAHATDKDRVNSVLGVYHYRDGQALDEKNTIQFNLLEDGSINPDWSSNYTWTDSKNYTHYPTWFEVKTELSLLKGDVIGFEKANPKVDGIKDYYKGCVTLGEITIEVAPDDNDFEDNGVGTEPDDTNYDVYGLGEFPISYWYTVEPSSYIKDGVYDYDLTKARYQEMRDAGINISLYYGHSVDRSITENKRIHDICAEVGLKFIGNTWAPDDATRIQQIKETFGNSDTYVGELLRDEPGANEFDALGTFVDAYNSALPDKEVYINLFPEYANAATQLKTDYENYIDQYLQKINTKSLSYDYYGLHKNGGIFNDFYSNLDLVRSKTLDKRMPFWVITQSGIAGSAKMPTELEQRWSVWANIAVGSKGISYFCYWTPSGGSYNDNGFMIDINGNRNPMYDWVKKINADINTIGKKLLHCHADGAILTATKYYPLYDNNGAGRSKYGPIQGVKGEQSILCGCFRDARRSENGDNYKGYKALVVSQMPCRTVTAQLTLDGSVTQITVTQNNTTKVVSLVNQMEETIESVKVNYLDGVLSLGIPDGEAVLIEF